VTGDEWYALEDQISVLRRDLFDLRDQLAQLHEVVRMLRYDLDVLDRSRTS